MSAEPGTSHEDESQDQRLDRNLIELLNELRVTGTGIQVLFAFLLIVPFNSGYKRMTLFDRTVYFVALLSVAVSAVLLIAPSVHHRLLFRHHQRPFIVHTANVVAIVAMSFLALGLLAILVLLSNVVFGELAAIVVGVITAPTIIGTWFGIALRRRRVVGRSGGSGS